MTPQEAIQWLNLEIEISEAECKSLHSIRDALRMAIDALEKQIPKKPKDFYCPVCSHYFGDGDERNYCPCCGQKSDWSDTDKDD